MAPFDKHVNRKLSCKSGVGPLKKPDGTLCVNNQENADILSDYFGSVWVDDDGANPIFPSRVPSDTVIDDIYFTYVSVFKTLSNLKNRSARALTKLSLYFIKGLLLFCLHYLHQCLVHFLKPIFCLWNGLLRTSDRFLRRSAHLTPAIIDLFH